MASAPPRRVRVIPAKGFSASYKKYKSAEVRANLTIFNHYKRTIPATALPGQMHDHALLGPLKGIRECHLAADVLLLYTHKNGIVKLLRVCEHDDLRGAKAKALKKTIKNL